MVGRDSVDPVSLRSFGSTESRPTIKKTNAFWFGIRRPRDYRGFGVG
jgi:hypothetical protein